MNNKNITPEELAAQLKELSADQFQQVVEYVAFLRYSARRATLAPMEERITELYRDFSERDRTLANAGVADYRDMLRDEDQA
jgi:hypothetical protein